MLLMSVLQANASEHVSMGKLTSVIKDQPSYTFYIVTYVLPVYVFYIQSMLLMSVLQANASKHVSMGDISN